MIDKDEQKLKTTPSPQASGEETESLKAQYVFAGLIALTVFFIMVASAEPTAGLLAGASTFATIALGIHLVTRWSLRTAVSITFGMCVLLLLLLPAVSTSPAATGRMMCSNSLKHIGIALQNYHDTYGSFPPAYFADSSGKPIHSWRVLILPFIEHKALYDKYRFDEPWDGPSNRKLHREVIDVYRCPSRSRIQPVTETSYVAIMGQKTMWPYEKSTKMTDITDGTANTIMVVEMLNSGTHWMEPRDLDMATMTSVLHVPNAACISSPHPKAALAVFADGHTQALTAGVSDAVANALLTIAGGEQIDPDQQ